MKGEYEIKIDLLMLGLPTIKMLRIEMLKSQQFEKAAKVREVEKILIEIDECLNKTTTP